MGCYNKHSFMISVKLKIYLDSSIPNYVFNDIYPQKQQAAKKLFVATNIITFVSPVTIYEIELSNEPRRADMLKLLKVCNIFQNTPEAEKLAQNYIKQNIFTKFNREDARHVAYAVYYGVDIIASYNFKHIVKLSTIKKLQAVNLILGFHTPEIRSPEEIDL